MREFVKQKLSSLTARLIVASATLLPLFLGVTGVFLDRAFNNSLEVAEQARLRSHINLLMTVAEPVDNADGSLRVLHLTLIDADFEQPNSGLYAYIFNSQKKLIWNSNSAALHTPPDYDTVSIDSKPGQLMIDRVNLREQEFFVAHYDVGWEDANGRPHPFRFLILHSALEYEAELKAYRRQLWRWLGASGLLLILAQVIILRWGLKPLGQFARALKAMQKGESTHIEGEHPRELQRIISNLNQVLAREQALRQRYRNSLSDLAHSLKTPLAVLKTNLYNSSPEDLRVIAEEQVARMNQVVTYQLQRAVSSQQTGAAVRTDIEPIVTRLVNALQKVYAHKEIRTEIHISAQAKLIGDEQDVMELLGNLLENAFKYGRSQVHVSAKEDSMYLCLEIEDDGAGVPEVERARIFQRGQRLDTNKPGQGIGLSIATEIIASYNGRLELTQSELGGAKFTVYMPMFLA